MDILNKKGIIPRVMGGLGNQIFIIIAGYITHKIHKCPLYIFDNDLNNNKHNINNFNYNSSIFKYFGTHLDKTIDNSFYIYLMSCGYNLHNISHDDGFKAWNPETLFPGTITSSYYQYYPVIKPYETEIRELLLKGLEEHPNKRILPNPDTSVFIHIRRGDYLNNPHIHYIQPLEYYKQAMLYILEKKQISKIYIFSDDIEWVQNTQLFDHHFFEIIDSKDELYSLHLMSQCKAGAICANSTFSWWGAFLGAYSQRNPVIVPSKWISLNVEALFPEEWIII
jgi:hypothetical protein